MFIFLYFRINWRHEWRSREKPEASHSGILNPFHSTSDHRDRFFRRIIVCSPVSHWRWATILRWWICNFSCSK